MTHSFKALLLGAAASIALVACGGGDDASSEVEVVSAAKEAHSPSPLDKPFKLKGAEPIDAEAFLANFEGDIEYDSVAFDEDIGATVITGLRPVTDGDEDFTIGRIELFGLNPDAFSAIETGQDLTEMTELFRKIRMYDISGSAPVNDAGLDAEAMGTFSIEALEVDAVKVMGEGTPAEEGSEANFNSGPSQVEFGGLALKGFNADVPLGENGEKVTFATPDARVLGYRDGKFGGLYLRDIDYTMIQSEETIDAQIAELGPQAAQILQGPLLRNMMFPTQQQGSVGELRWDGMDIAGLIPFIESEETPPVSETDLLSIGGFVMSDQKVYVNGKEAGTVEKTVMDPIEFYHFMPKKIRIYSEGGKADLTAYVGDEDPEIADILTKNGLDDIDSQSEMKYAFDPKSGAIDLGITGEAKGLYGMAIDMALTDFDYDTVVGSDDDTVTQTALMNTAVKGFTLKIEDEKLLDTIFTIAGSATEQDPATLRQNVIGILSLGALQGAQISPRIPEYVTALSTFVGEGGELTIKLDPDAPVTFGTLAASGQANPAGVLDTLNVTVERD